MHDMSNTRKEIAARLGFAAGNGAKEEFAIDARDELMMRTWIKNNYPKADNAAFNKMLAKMTKEYAKDPKGYTYGGGFRAVAKAAGFSRDGAKATMAKPPRKYEHGDRVYIMDGNKRVGSGVIDYMFDYDDFVGTYIYKVRQEDGGRASYNETSLKKMSRPGAKASFDNKQIAQGLSRLLKETGFDGMASDVLSGSSDSETLRKYVRVLKGKMSPLSGDAKSAELLSKLEKMLSSRPGAKAMMARWEESNSEGWGDLSKSLTATINGTKFEIVLDASTGKGTLMRGTQVVKEGAVEQLKKYAETVKASRPGTKTRMTREQTEEQKAGLKIMSAADPAVGAKIAKLIKEGKPQDQAVAIALDMKRRGEL